MNILIMLILLIHEHSICFHLFVSSSISFFSVLQFSEHRSFTSLVKFIPRYFIFLVAVVNEIFFLISLYDISLLKVTEGMGGDNGGQKWKGLDKVHV